MDNKGYDLHNLTENQVKLILEALLFSCSVDVNSCWYKEEIEEMAELSISLRGLCSDIPLNNIYLCDEKYFDTTTEKIVEYFPELMDNKPNL
jgi:hypothetical protein